MPQSVTAPHPAARGKRSERLLLALAITTLLQWLASSVALPLLPLWLRGRGCSDVLVGLAMGSFFLGALIAQYPLGRLSDRIAPHRLLAATVLGYALTSAAFLIPLDAGSVVGLRAAQGAAAGATEVLTLTLIGRCIPAARRTRGYTAIFAAQTAGLAIGPLASGVGLAHMTTLFAVTAGIALAAALPLVALRALPTGLDPTPPAPDRQEHGWTAAGLRLVVAAAAVTGLATGVYEACWTLLLDHRGASSWQIGLSWTLFSAAFLAVSAVAGRFGDRLDPRRVVIATLGCSVALLAVYPLLTSVAVVIAMGAAEGALTALAYPAAQSLLARVVPRDRLGHARGGVASVQTAAIAVAALAGGWLFAAAPWLPFVVAGAAGATLLALGAVGSAARSGDGDRQPHADPGAGGRHRLHAEQSPGSRNPSPV